MKKNRQCHIEAERIFGGFVDGSISATLNSTQNGKIDLFPKINRFCGEYKNSIPTFSIPAVWWRQIVAVAVVVGRLAFVANFQFHFVLFSISFANHSEIVWAVFGCAIFPFFWELFRFVRYICFFYFEPIGYHIWSVFVFFSVLGLLLP